MPKMDRFEDESDIESERDIVDSDNSRFHSKLIKDLGKLSKNKRFTVNHNVRTTLQTNEKAEALKVLKEMGSLDVKKATEKLQELPKPLEKPAALRAKRAAGFEKVSCEVNKWDGIVRVNRLADQLVFPAQRVDLRVRTQEKMQSVRPHTELETKVYAMLKGAKLLEEKNVANEEAAKRALTLEELKEKNREIWRQRELRRQFEHKAMMQNKSKSKKYHRLLRRDKLAKQKLELDHLKKSDPEKAMDILQQLEDSLLEGRMSLKHRKSKWALAQMARAGQDKGAKAIVQELSERYKELVRTVKVRSNDKESEDENHHNEMKPSNVITLDHQDSGNPWLKSQQSLIGQKSEVDIGAEDESFVKYKKFWDSVNQRDEIERKKSIEKTEVKIGNKKEKEYEKEMENVEEPELLAEKEEIIKGNELPEEPSEVNKVETMAIVASEKKRKRKKRKQAKEIDIDEIFETAQMQLASRVDRKIARLQTKLNKKAEVAKKQKEGKKEAIGRRIVAGAQGARSAGGKGNIKIRKSLKICNIENDNHLKTRPALDLNESTGEREEETGMDLLKVALQKRERETQEPKAGKHIDPKKFIHIGKKNLLSFIPDLGLEGEEIDSEGEGETPEDVIREAFADDYFVDEFQSEKKTADESILPKSTDLKLPGWGEWAGVNLKPSKRRTRRFRLRTRPLLPRPTPSTPGNVIINESADKHANLRKVMVSEIPFPFSSVKDFEASVRAPLGRMFVPETVHQKLISPSLVTRLGTIIDPMDEESLLGQRKIRVGEEIMGQKKGGYEKREGNGGHGKRKGQTAARFPKGSVRGGKRHKLGK